MVTALLKAALMLKWTGNANGQERLLVLPGPGFMAQHSMVAHNCLPPVPGTDTVFWPLLAPGRRSHT